MNIKKRVGQLFDPYYRFVLLKRLGWYNNIPDEKYLKKMFALKMGMVLDLENPQTFNEKLQWLKVYDRNPLYTSMVDKYEAKKYVSNIIGDEYIIPTLGVWDKFEDINFDSLPNQFVLKCTHDSGGLVICRDKKTFDFTKAESKIKKTLKRNYYFVAKEWPYKNVKPRIIAEKYMEDEYNKNGLVDYKFYCFGGEPKFLYVSQGLENHATASISFLTTDWEFAPYERTDYKPLDKLPQKPANFEKMKDICRVLAKAIPFLRVDLYEINGQIYFSELTFTPAAGFMKFKNPEHDKEIGTMLVLPAKTEI